MERKACLINTKTMQISQKVLRITTCTVPTAHVTLPNAYECQDNVSKAYCCHKNAKYPVKIQVAQLNLEKSNLRKIKLYTATPMSDICDHKYPVSPL